VPLEIARERLDRTREKDRFEQEADAFFLRTRAVYLARAAQYPQRFSVVDATASIDDIRLSLAQKLDGLVARSQQI
jgi:dTMP kinase